MCVLFSERDADYMWEKWEIYIIGIEITFLTQYLTVIHMYLVLQLIVSWNKRSASWCELTLIWRLNSRLGNKEFAFRYTRIVICQINLGYPVYTRVPTAGDKKVTLEQNVLLLTIEIKVNSI